MVPYRESYWNIGSERYLLIPIAIAATVLFVLAFRAHLLMWRLGKKENRFDRPWDRIKGLFVYGFANRRLLNEAYPGAMHLLIYGGMLVLFAGTILNSAEYYLHMVFNLSFLRGSFYLGYSLVLDVAGILVIVGLVLAACRRYVQKPDRLDSTSDDWISLAAIGLIVVSGFLVEGFRIAASEIAEHPDWSVWSPVGYVLALGFNSFGVPESTQLLLHRIVWWTHLLSAQTWIAYLFYSKLGHIFISPLNIYFRNLGPSGALQPIPDMENALTLGAGNIQDLTWKQLLDLDACTLCGRCQDVCPAYLTGKPLSPKQLVLGLKAHMMSVASNGKRTLDGAGTAGSVESESIFGHHVGEDAIWACTTCGACQKACPVFVEHINKVVDARRNVVLMEGRMPETVQAVLTNLERRGHPWIGTPSTRTDWMDELGIKPLESGEEAELLYWVGCTGALENRSRKITRAVAKLLTDGGVKFGVLGAEEGCCGDPARRIGNEYLYKTMVEHNIEVLRSHKVKRILTHCPHCFNSLNNEYPYFGGDFEVIHHSQFLAELVQQGRLRFGEAITEKVVLHDSCYLGRHNEIYSAPRELLKSVPGLQLVEMRRSGQSSFCCGAGGGHMWMEDTTGPRINEARTEQALETGAGVVAVSCPFCLQMFEAGIRAKDVSSALRVADISELLETAQSEERSNDESRRWTKVQAFS